MLIFVGLYKTVSVSIVSLHQTLGDRFENIYLSMKEKAGVSTPPFVEVYTVVALSLFIKSTVIGVVTTLAFVLEFGLSVVESVLNKVVSK